jgi:hyperosmotically inducible protein
MTRRMALALIAPLSAAAQKAPVSDNYIYDQVRIRLTADVDVKGGDVVIGVKEGVVTLRGRVDSERAKNKAEKLTKKIKGVRQVVNELRVEKPS